MKVLILSLDPQILDKNSESYKRMEEYSSLVRELHIFVFDRRGSTGGLVLGNADPQADHKLYLYSFGANFFGWIKALFFGRKLVKEKQVDVISAQEPFELGFLGFFIIKFSRFHRPEPRT